MRSRASPPTHVHSMRCRRVATVGVASLPSAGMVVGAPRQMTKVRHVSRQCNGRFWKGGMGVAGGDCQERALW